MWGSIFDCGECGPIAQLKCASGLLQIRSGEVVQIQAIAGGEYQMIESAKLRKEGCNGSFVRNVNHLPLCFSAYGFNGSLNSLMVA
jgi:hypothetical protein